MPGRRKRNDSGAFGLKEISDFRGETPELGELIPPREVIKTKFSDSDLYATQLLYGYESGEWEAFIREWATALRPGYVQIKRFGGPNDRGVDVAGFKTENGFEASWDCFQGKHYSKALTPSDAFPEILKIFLGVIDGHYTMPSQYCFLAPHGCGPKLSKLLSSPSSLRAEFLEFLDGTQASNTDMGLFYEVKALVGTTDFSLFKSIELEDALSLHKNTRYYLARFGGQVPSRTEIDAPPERVMQDEAVYVEQLLKVYAELHSKYEFKLEHLENYSLERKHFRRQREHFYSAESLRLHARDSVPPGTFEALQEDIFTGVEDISQNADSSSMERLNKVLTTSTMLDLSAHSLYSIANFADRKGICHQLANNGRLSWVGTCDE